MESPFAPIQPITSKISAPTEISEGLEEGKPFVDFEKEGAPKFENIFSRYLKTANDTLMTAKEMGDKIATGELKNLHQATVAGAKAEIMLKLTTQIAAKLSSACTTLFQMQL